jgi:hypothetical protein
MLAETDIANAEAPTVACELLIKIQNSTFRI